MKSVTVDRHANARDRKQAEYEAARYQANRPAKLAYQAKYYADHRDERLAAMAAYGASHKAEQRLRNVVRYTAQRRPIVYVLKDAMGAVIYVGRGSPDRVHAHKRQSWTGEIARVLIKRCSDWGQSLVIEAMLIRRHRPNYNTVGVTK